MKKEAPVIIVHYINVHELPNIKRSQMLYEIKSVIEKNSENYNGIMNIIMPVQSGESRVECINPRYMDEEEFENIHHMAEVFKGILDEKLKGNENLFA